MECIIFKYLDEVKIPEHSFSYEYWLQLRVTFSYSALKAKLALEINKSAMLIA